MPEKEDEIMDINVIFDSVMQFATTNGETLAVAAVVTCFLLLPTYVVSCKVADAIKAGKKARKQRNDVMERVRKRRIAEGR